MKKQFVTLMAILGLSASLAGCGKTEAPVVPETAIESEVQENEVSELPAEELSAEETETVIAEEAETPVSQEITEQAEETVKTEDKKDTVSESKPSTNSQTAKPNTNTSSGSTSSSKPSTNNTVTKPNNSGSSSGNTTTTPQTKPEVKPEATPEVKPEATPEAKPETTPEATPEAKPETASLSAQEIFSSITSGIEFPKQMDVDATLLNDLYNIDASLLDSYCVKMPMMSAHLAEVGVFKVKDANNVSSIVAGINQRAGNVGQCLYPSLIETFESRVIVTKGNYILFAMDENASKLEASFNSLVK